MPEGRHVFLGNKESHLVGFNAMFKDEILMILKHTTLFKIEIHDISTEEKIYKYKNRAEVTFCHIDLSDFFQACPY